MSADNSQEGARPEIGEKVNTPKIEYLLYFSSHSLGSDIRSLPQYFAKSDIYVPESMGWDGSTRDTYTRVSNGHLAPEEAMKKIKTNTPGFCQAQLEMLFSSQKAIVRADLPEGHPLVEKIHEANINYEKEPDLSNDFAEILSQKRQSAEESVALQQQREMYIVANLPDLLQDAVESNPRLKSKPTVKALVFLGAFHTGVFHKLKEKYGDSVSCEYSSPEFLYSIKDEIERRIAFGKEVDDLLLARSFIESLVSKRGAFYIRQFCPDSEKQSVYFRRVAESFSLEEIRTIFETASGSHTTLMLNLSGKLKEKGLQSQHATTQSVQKLIG